MYMSYCANCEYASLHIVFCMNVAYNSINLGNAADVIENCNKEARMVNLNNLFNRFSLEITISSSKRDSLKRSRDAMRQDIKDWFSENDKPQPSFCGQGSYAMKTLINPINGNDYDIDDGIYINGFDEDISEWPTPATVHAWIKSAVQERTHAGIIDKDTCVRVRYSSGYHIDLPAYILRGDDAYLAHKTKGWFISDPKSFSKWFVEKVKNEYTYGEQLRSVVKYLKAWKDYTGNPLKGIEITILAANYFEKYEGRDDKCLKETIDRIITTLEYSFHCYKPVEPYEDLFEDSSETRKKRIVNGLKSLSDCLSKAIVEDDERKASEILRKEAFGTRFPLGSEAENDSYAASTAPGVLKSDGRSA